jgi:hypothetical protein
MGNAPSITEAPKSDEQLEKERISRLKGAQMARLNQRKVVMNEIEINKKRIDENIRIIHRIRQTNPLASINPQFFEQIIQPQKNQIMMNEQQINNLSKDLEILNREINNDIIEASKSDKQLEEERISRLKGAQMARLNKRKVVMEEIDYNKKRIDENKRIINDIRQTNPMFAQNPQMLDLYTQRQKNQIMMHEQKINNLSNELEQLNREIIKNNNIDSESNKEKFSVESESICDSDSCKNLIFNELKEKHEKRLQNDSVKIQSLRQRIDNINNEIGGLVNQIQSLNNNPMLRYGGPSQSIILAQINEANNRLSILRNQLPNLVNELKYLLSFDIEFIELQKEMNTF